MANQESGKKAHSKYKIMIQVLKIKAANPYVALSGVGFGAAPESFDAIILS